MKKFLLAILILLMSCSTQTSPSQEVILHLIVRQATIRVIDGKPDRAVRVQKIIQEARMVVEGEKEITVALAVEALRQAIDAEKLTPADQLLIEDLLKLVQVEIEDKIGIGVLNPEQKAFLSEVLKQAELAATLPM
jgi:hypothetical protein